VFTKIGKIISSLAVFLGLLSIIGSVLVASDMFSTEFTRQSMAQSTLLFNHGSILVCFGLVFGVLCEISQKLDK
jgi:hypothetical protein